MKKVKFLSLLLTVALSTSVLMGCGKKDTAGTEPKKGTETAEAKKVKITFLNSKGEIQAQLEEAAKTFTSENPNITVDVITATAGQSPFEKVSAMYASGNAPTLSMLDPADIPKFKDKFIDVSGEKWVKDALPGALDPAKVDGKLYGFPLAIEGYGLIYNKAILDKASVDPTTIKTTKDLEDAFKKVQSAGVAPVIVSPMDWSLGAHFFTIAYMDQSKEAGAADKFVEDIKAGKVDLNTNKLFNGLIDTFDVLKNYNLDKASPLAGAYEKGPEAIGSGEVGFWFMGNWAWPQIKDFDTADEQYGFIPVPVSNNAEDFGNSQIYGGPSKFIGIDKENNDADQQAAGKKFLEWLIYSEKGQDILVNKASVVPAFANIKLEIKDPLGRSIKEYMEKGLVVPSIATLPGDHWAKVGASMQKYLSNAADRATLAKEIVEYWKNVK